MYVVYVLNCIQSNYYIDHIHSYIDIFINRVARKTARNIEINGQLFPKGCAIVLPIMAIHYEPENWPEPNLFKPERYSCINYM